MAEATSSGSITRRTDCRTWPADIGNEDLLEEISIAMRQHLFQGHTSAFSRRICPSFASSLTL
ncbi:hypothetical protein [Bradyrhizobium japonicum]|uniref:hypothetical protein n=1 Tax=Bradyrhizobium japonicum TaxID=375 RepID=UPI001BA79D39|nr:hypothetical protein [Bradyrhizobium japonicum]MBR0956584.1 hypothetical protein [Bradyrhizobium japonicum]